MRNFFLEYRQKIKKAIINLCYKMIIAFFIVKNLVSQDYDNISHKIREIILKH